MHGVRTEETSDKRKKTSLFEVSRANRPVWLAEKSSLGHEMALQKIRMKFMSSWVGSSVMVDLHWHRYDQHKLDEVVFTIAVMPRQQAITSHMCINHKELLF